MNCTKCSDKGFTEAPMLMSAGNFGFIKQCCDIKKYSAEVERRINPNKGATILPFRRKDAPIEKEKGQN